MIHALNEAGRRAARRWFAPFRSEPRAAMSRAARLPWGLWTVALCSGLAALTVVQAAPPSPGDLAALYDAAGLRARDGAYYLEGCATPLRPQTETVDLAPQVQGVLIYLGTSKCFPDTQGGNVAVFVKDADGRWVDRSDWIPGVEVVAQPSSGAGWADLGVANPGGCMPVYRYDGRRYGRHSQKALQPGGCQFRE